MIKKISVLAYISFFTFFTSCKNSNAVDMGVAPKDSSTSASVLATKSKADSAVNTQKTISNPKDDLIAIKAFCHSNEFTVLFRLVSESDLPNKDNFFRSFDITLNDSNLVHKYFTDSEDGGNDILINDKYVVISYNISPHSYGILVYNRVKKNIYADNLLPGNLLDDILEVTASPTVYNKKTNSDDFYDNEGVLNLNTKEVVWTKKTLDHSNPREN